MKLATVIGLSAALVLAPMQVGAEEKTNEQNAALLECGAVLIVVGVGIYIWVRVIRPMCLRIESNQNWLLTNVVGTGYAPLRSPGTGSGTTRVQTMTGLGRVWVDDLEINMQQSGNVLTVTASRNGKVLETQAATITNGKNATVTFTTIAPPAETPSRFFRLAE